jgi:hypothetical protein
MSDGPAAAAAHETVRVYVDGRGVDVPAAGTALDAVRALDPAAADAIVAGTRALADSRGLPTEPSVRVHGGAIFRLVSARARSAAASDEPDALDAS